MSDRTFCARAWCDGLCEPFNPGGVATYGYVLALPDGSHFEGWGLASPGGPGSTNNLAEYTAIIQALRRLHQLGWSGPVVVHSDSQLAIRQLQGRYAVRAPALRRLHREAAEAAALFASVRWQWVPRKQNRQADALSRRAYQEHLLQQPAPPGGA